MKESHEELMVLSHEAVPGYRPIFFIAVAVGLIYLAVIFLTAH